MSDNTSHPSRRTLLKGAVAAGGVGIDTKRIKNADKITSLFTKGEVGGKKVGDQGTAPKKVMYLDKPDAKTFSATPTQFMTLIPTVYNADTLGIRPDLIKRPIESWKELLNPEFKGKAAILNIPSIGIMDAAMVVEASGIHKYPDKGNMTKAEIDLTIKTLIEAKKAGQFRALPLIAPSLVGVGMFGFTLSWDEIARTSQAIGDVNTLPLELQGLTSTVTTPAIYALGTVTTVVSFAVMGGTLALMKLLRARSG